MHIFLWYLFFNIFICGKCESPSIGFQLAPLLHRKVPVGARCGARGDVFKSSVPGADFLIKFWSGVENIEDPVPGAVFGAMFSKS